MSDPIYAFDRKNDGPGNTIYAQYVNELQEAVEEISARTGGDVAVDTHAATSKTTPVDADELALVDSAASWGLKKLTWANLKTAMKASLIPSQSGKAGQILASDGTNMDWRVADLPRYRMISGRRYGTATAFGGWRNGSVGLSPGWLFCVPVLIASPCTISGLSINVTGTTSTDMILGLYDDDGAIGPGTRLRSGSISPASTGVKTVTFGTAVVIDRPKWVWVTWSNPDGGGNVEACTAISPFAGMDSSYIESYVLQAGPSVSSPPDPFPSSGYSWIDSGWKYPNITVVIA